jgi:hypothetical protein
MILMDSLVARKTEDIMLPEVLLEQDEEWLLRVFVLSCYFYCYVLDF